MRWLLATLATAMLALGIGRGAWPWVVDDAYISLRFAERLVEGHGLTWTDGERVEGYSNLLWVLLTALLGRLGCDWTTAIRALGIACTLGTFAVLLASRLVPASLPALLAVPLLAAIGAIPVWAIGGLEVPLLLLLLTGAMAALHRALCAARGTAPDGARMRRGLWLAGIALGLACWTRPDAPLWAVVAAATWLAFAPLVAAQRVRLLACLALPIAVALVLQLAFRLAYYGDWLPNTGRAKVSPSAESRMAGLNYVESAAVALRALLLPAALGALAFAERCARPLLCFALGGSALWWAYVYNVGGDTFPQNRLLVPTLAPLAVLAAHGFDRLAALGRAAHWAATALAVFAIGAARYDAEHPRDPRHELTEWEWSGIATGEWLGQAFARERPLLAVDAAGAVPFASRLPCIDMLGLCDRTIASTPWQPEAGFIPGHTRANGKYVLSRQPDLVMFGLPPGGPQPQWLGGRQMEADPDFLRDYRVVLFHTGPTRLGDGRTLDLRLTLWTRVEGRVGVVRDTDGVHVPGYLLGSYRQPYSFYTLPDDPAAVAARTADMQRGAAWWFAASVVGVRGVNGVVGEVRSAGEHVLVGLRLPAGEYRVHAAGVPLGVAFALRGTAVAPHGDAWTISANGTAVPSVDLVCTVPPDGALPVAIHHVDIVPVR